MQNRHRIAPLQRPPSPSHFDTSFSICKFRKRRILFNSSSVFVFYYYSKLHRKILRIQIYIFLTILFFALLHRKKSSGSCVSWKSRPSNVCSSHFILQPSFWNAIKPKRRLSYEKHFAIRLAFHNKTSHYTTRATWIKHGRRSQKSLLRLHRRLSDEWSRVRGSPRIHHSLSIQCGSRVFCAR